MLMNGVNYVRYLDVFLHSAAYVALDPIFKRTYSLLSILIKYRNRSSRQEKKLMLNRESNPSLHGEQTAR